MNEMNLNDVYFAHIYGEDCSVFAITLLVSLIVFGVLIQLAMMFTILHMALKDSADMLSLNGKNIPRITGHS